MKSALPNLLTLSNLLAGCMAIVFVFDGHLEWASLAVLSGMVFDFFDGLVARALKVESAVGKELDSLADMVTFGVVPGLIVYRLLKTSLESQEMSDNMEFMLPFSAFLITIGAGYRLAKFNVLPSQVHFIGLPTPANALLIVALPLILAYQGSDAMNTIILNHQVLLFLVVLSTTLMNMPIKMMSLKLDSSNWKDMLPQIILVCMSVVFIITLKFASLPLIICSHILISIIKWYPR